MTSDPHDPTHAAPHDNPIDRAHPAAVADGERRVRTDVDTSAGAPYAESPAASVADRGSVDPINGWATEHYGFDDDTAPEPARPVPTGGAPADVTVARVRRTWTLVGAGVLGLVLTGAVGDAAIAAVADDGAGGRGAVSRVGGGDFEGDGGRRGGSR